MNYRMSISKSPALAVPSCRILLSLPVEASPTFDVPNMSTLVPKLIVSSPVGEAAGGVEATGGVSTSPLAFLSSRI